MKSRITHSPFFPTLARYARTLREDVSFTLSAKMLLRILLLALGAFLLLGVAGGRWAEVYGDGGGQDWKQYLFGLLGAIDAKPEAGSGSVLYRRSCGWWGRWSSVASSRRFYARWRSVWRI